MNRFREKSKKADFGPKNPHLPHLPHFKHNKNFSQKRVPSF